jgi:aspartate kinase
MKILKFGGTSVGNAARMKALAPMIADDIPKIVVLSAMSGTTNALIEITKLIKCGKASTAIVLIEKMSRQYEQIAAELYRNPKFWSAATLEMNAIFALLRSMTNNKPFTPLHERTILAQGELLSTCLLNFHLHELGINSILLPALNFMRKDITDAPDLYFIREILSRDIMQYPDNRLFLTQGYICRNHEGEIDNLQRGGSDYTASLIGAAIGASEVQIWTDIDGFHNNDPRVVQHTHSIARLSFDEASELAYFGAKILHPLCVAPVHEAGIPLVIKNTMNPTAIGTVISASTDGEGKIKAVAAKDGITAVNIKSGRMLMAYGFLRKIFDVFEQYRTPIDMITTSEVAVSLTIDDDTHLQRIVEELSNYGRVETQNGMTIICVVGSHIAESNNVAGRIFAALGDLSVRMISFGGSHHNISFLVRTDDKRSALEALNGLMDS